GAAVTLRAACEKARGHRRTATRSSGRKADAVRRRGRALEEPEAGGRPCRRAGAPVEQGAIRDAWTRDVAAPEEGHVARGQSGHVARRPYPDGHHGRRAADDAAVRDGGPRTDRASDADRRRAVRAGVGW